MRNVARQYTKEELERLEEFWRKEREFQQAREQQRHIDVERARKEQEDKHRQWLEDGAKYTNRDGGEMYGCAYILTKFVQRSINYKFRGLMTGNSETVVGKIMARPDTYDGSSEKKTEHAAIAFPGDIHHAVHSKKQFDEFIDECLRVRTEVWGKRIRVRSKIWGERKYK